MPGRRQEMAQCSSMTGAEAGGEVGGGRPWPGRLQSQALS